MIAQLSGTSIFHKILYFLFRFLLIKLSKLEKYIRRSIYFFFPYIMHCLLICKPEQGLNWMHFIASNIEKPKVVHLIKFISSVYTRLYGSFITELYMLVYSCRNLIFKKYSIWFDILICMHFMHFILFGSFAFYFFLEGW